MRLNRLIILPLLASAPAGAQTASPVGSAKLQEYRIDAGESIVEFSVGFAFNRVKGRFQNVNGTILYDVANPARSSISVIIETKSLDTGWPHRDEHLKTSDFFDVEKFPTIVFQSDRLTSTPNGWRADGKLTMHGVTKQISIPFHLLQPPTRAPESNWMIMNAAGSVKLARADFGIFGGDKFNSWFNKARQATMSDSVDVNLEIEAYNPDIQSQQMGRVAQLLKQVDSTGVQAQIDRLKNVMQTRPEAAPSVLNGGDFVVRALIGNGKIDDALKLSRALAEMLPLQPRAHIAYGAALSIAGNSRAAQSEFAKAKEVFKPPVRDPNEKFPQVDDNWYYLDQFARALIEWNRVSAAIPVARVTAEMYADNARAQTTLGLALAASGDRRNAQAAYAHALTLDPKESRALEYQRR